MVSDLQTLRPAHKCNEGTVGKTHWPVHSFVIELRKHPAWSISRDLYKFCPVNNNSPAQRL